MFIVTCLFAIVAIMYTYRCIAGCFYKASTSAMQIFLMAIGIVGTVAGIALQL